MLSARTNYFRATYAINARNCAPAAESMLRSPTLLDAARALYGRGAVTPFLLYANVMVPGQELGLHTDVPAYRGVSPAMVPVWLLVVMRHSGRFEDRRIPIATAVVYFGESRGGDLALYPDGADSDVVTLVPRRNAYVTFDADSVFHGVDRLDGDATPLRHLGSHSQLSRRADDTWTLSHGDGCPASYGEGDVRFSVSWKAYCYADATEKTATDTVSVGSIIDTLVEELCDRGRLPGVNHGLSDVELGRLLIDEFVRFPSPTSGRSAGSSGSLRPRSGH
ncbi:MAG: hypothetical protein ACHQNA_04115 [Acidimicrobiales bacterium]